MDLNRLPHLPLHFFYFQLSKPFRGAFWLLMVLLAGLAAIWLYTYENQTQWALQVTEVADTFTESVPVDTLEHHYRSFPIEMNAYRQVASFSASALQAPAWPFLLGMMIQVMAWSLVLAAASFIRSRWSLLFFFLFGFWLHSTKFREQVLGEALTGYLLEIGLILLFLGLAYLFQRETIKANLWLRWGLFCAMLAGLFIWSHQNGGWLAIHQMWGYSFIYLAILSLVFVLFVSKDANNLLVFLATNRKNPQQRLAAPWVYLGLGLWLFLALLWLDFYLELNLLVKSEPGLRPSHLLAVLAVLTPFLSQNQFHQVKDIFSSTGGYTLIIAAWGLISLSFWWVYASSFDPILVYGIDRLASIAFMGVGLGYLLFLLLNHQELLRRRVNLYYLLGNGPKVAFSLVWIAGLTFWVFIEGSESWKTMRILSHSYAIQFADRFYQEGAWNDAELHYDIARKAVISSPKANYNLASLRLGRVEETLATAQLYEASGSRFDFPYGYLNAGNLLRLRNRPASARESLKEGTDRFPDYAPLWNNLGTLFLERAEPDSAILAYKQGLLADLDASSIYSNLAQVYWRYDRKEEALEFLQSSLGTSSSSEAAQINAWWYQSLHPGALELPTLPEEASPLLTYNYKLATFEEADTVGRGQIQALANTGQAPDATLLEAFLLYREDSVSLATSRLSYLAESYPSYASRAFFLMGVDYYQRGAPELAKYYFERQAQAGDTLGRLYAAKMKIDLGMTEDANADLSLLRAEAESLWLPCTKEISMLLRAYGQELYAQIEYDQSLLSFDEKVRMGRYADSMSYYSTALNIFQEIGAQDASNPVPYLELGRIYNRYCDTLASVNLSLGLAENEGNEALSIQQSKALICQGELDAAQSLLQSLAPSDPTLHKEWGLIQSELWLAREDTTKALEELLDFVEVYPFDSRMTQKLAELLLAQADYGGLNALAGNALTLNDQNPYYWYYFAKSAQGLGFPEDVAFGAQKAIELAYQEFEREGWAREFAPELREAAE